MGTPHRGGNNATLGKIAAHIATASLSSLSNDFMESLSRNSLLTEERSELFRHQLEDYYILSFYETLGRKVKGKGIGIVSLMAISIESRILRNGPDR